MTEQQQPAEETGEQGEKTSPPEPDYKAQLKEQQSQLTKAQADVARLEKVASKFGKLKEAEEQAKIKQAEEQGEWQQLHGTVKSDLAAATKELEAAQAKIAKRDEFLEGQVTEALSAIPKEARKALEESLAPIGAMGKIKAIAAFNVALGNTADKPPAAKRGGSPGPAKTTPPTKAELARGTPSSEAARRAELAKTLMEQGIDISARR